MVSHAAKAALLVCLLFAFEVAPFSFAPLTAGKVGRAPLFASPDPRDMDTSTRRTFLLEACAAASVLLPAKAALADDENNEFIKELKARSDVNRDKYNNQARTADKLNSGQFASQYDKPKFVAIRRLDGTYKMVSPEVLDDLLAKQLVVAEYDNTATTKDGPMKVDYKKGRILQFPNTEAQNKVEKSAKQAP